MLAMIRMCNFCRSTPVRQLSNRCLKVHCCDGQCQMAHWNRDVLQWARDRDCTDPEDFFFTSNYGKR